MTAANLHLFAGPSLFDTPFHSNIALAWPGITLHPPARRGDIEDLLKANPAPSVLALADGTFHTFPSVSHIELRDALDAGWQVYGLCSMGAIRACEMAHMGMRPWGRVAEAFCANRDMADDEVALLHGSEFPYLPISEPLLHIREFLHRMFEQGLLGEKQLGDLATSMQGRWYGNRTLQNLRAELAAVVTARTLLRLDNELADFGRFRLKQRDLVAFLEARPWQTNSTSRLPDEASGHTVGAASC